MANRDLRLNSIPSRKESPRLVLEEHGHCEVPAGCGGVVLRWRGRDRLPIEMWLYSGGEARAYLDGVAVTSSRPLVRAGEHVLAFGVTGLKPGEGVLMFAAIGDPEKHVRRVEPASEGGRAFGLLSLDDGTWKYSTGDSADDSWTEVGYDDSGWRPMVAEDFPTPPEAEYRRSFLFKKVTTLGARGLGIGRPAEVVRIRRTFALPPV